MTFPDTPLGVHVELAFGADLTDPDSWTWTDMSGWTFTGGEWVHDPYESRVNQQAFTIRRGRQDESSQPSPASTSGVLDNRDGALTPGNPQGLGLRRGTPMRLWVHDGDRYARVGDGAGFSTTDDTSVTGDLWVAAEFDPNPLHGQQVLFAKDDAASEHSWFVQLTNGGTSLNLTWWDSASVDTVTGSVALPSGERPQGRHAVALHFDVDDGAGGSVLRCYRAASLDGPWTLTDTVERSSTTAIDASDAALEFGTGWSEGSGSWNLYRGEVRAGDSAGTVIADPDLTGLTRGDTSFTDDAGNDWTATDTEITDEHVRFVGEVTEIRPTWPYGDLSTSTDDGESSIQVVASSALRRLGQGSKPIRSPLARHWSNHVDDAPVTAWYWSAENLTNTKGPAWPAGGPPLILSGGWELTSGAALVGSGSLPKLPNGSSGGWSVAPVGVGGGGADGLWGVVVAVHMDEVPGSSIPLLTTNNVHSGNTAGTFDTVRLTLNSTTLTVTVLLDGSSAASTTLDVTGIAGVWSLLSVSCLVGASPFARKVSVLWSTIDGLTTASWESSDFAFGAGPLTSVRRPTGSAPPQGISYGHIIAGVPEPLNPWPTGKAANPYLGHPERAIARMTRIADDHDLPLTTTNDPSNSQPLGPEPHGTFLDVMQQAASADLGILVDHFDGPGLHYRSHTTLYNQDPALTLDARGGEIIEPFEPTLDDQRLRNDLTVSNSDDSASDIDQDSIDAEGQYDESITVNVPTYMLRHQAGWRLRMGTWPGLRYPTVALEMVATEGDPIDLANRWLRVRVGDRIQVTNLPPQHPTDADLIVEGWSETLAPFAWSVEMNCSPAGPWDAGVLDDPGFRLDTLGSTLAAGIDDDDTSFTVNADPLWETTDVPYGIVIDGERMTVTAVSGASSPQTFTVTRDPDQAVAHDSGAQVRVADPFVIALGGAAL